MKRPIENVVGIHKTVTCVAICVDVHDECGSDPVTVEVVVAESDSVIVFESFSFCSSERFSLGLIRQLILTNPHFQWQRF